MITLYHYKNRADDESILLDPLYASSNYNSFSIKEYGSSDVPRLFFYLDPTHKENFFSPGNPFTAMVPAADIYNLRKDPLGIIKKIKEKAYGAVDYNLLLQEISGWKRNEETKQYEQTNEGISKGLYYKIGNMEVIVWFEEINVTREKENKV